MGMDRAAQIAASVRAEMARQCVRQAELAARVGRNQAWVSRRLTCTVEFSAAELATVADALNVPASSLLGEGAAA